MPCQIHCLYTQVLARDKKTKKMKQRVITPRRQPVVRSLSRRSYKAATSTFTRLPRTSVYLLQRLVSQIRKEITAICSLKHNSILRGNHKTLKNFSWTRIWHELYENVPTLIKLFQSLFPKAGKKFICFLTAMILKKSCMQMSLVQRVISFLLYANGTNREVSINKILSVIVLMVYCLGIHIPAAIHGLYGTINN